jgi:hypothetical protein
MKIVFIILIFSIVNCSIQSSRNGRILDQFYELVYLKSHKNPPEEVGLLNYMVELEDYYTKDPVGLVTLVKDHWNYTFKAAILQFFAQDRKKGIISGSRIPINPFDYLSLNNMTADLSAIIENCFIAMTPGNNEESFKTIEVLMEIAKDIKRKGQRIDSKYARSVGYRLWGYLIIWRFLLENIKFPNDSIEVCNFPALFKKVQVIVQSKPKFNTLTPHQVGVITLFRIYCIMIHSKCNLQLFDTHHHLLISYFVEKCAKSNPDDAGQ